MLKYPGSVCNIKEVLVKWMQKNIPKVIEAKQTAKALQKEQVKVLYIAKDAETKVIDPLEEAKSRSQIMGFLP